MAEAAKSEEKISGKQLRILRPFLHDISSFLNKNQMSFVYEAHDDHL